MARLSAVAAILLLTACSDPDFSPQSTASASSDSEDGIDPNSPTDGYAPLAEPPQMVTGAWLTCGIESVEAADETTYGCGAYENNQKSPGNIDDWAITVRDKNTGDTIKPPLAIAATESPWHVQFSLPGTLDQAKVQFAAAATIEGKSLSDAVAFDAGPMVSARRADQIFLTSFTYSRADPPLNEVSLVMKVMPKFISDLGKVEIRYVDGVDLYPAPTCNDDKDTVMPVEEPELKELGQLGTLTIKRILPSDDCSSCAIRICGYKAGKLNWTRDKLIVPPVVP